MSRIPVMSRVPVMALTALLFAPTAFAADDNELMEQVDEDAFDADLGDTPDWDIPTGDDASDAPAPLGDDPDEGLGPIDDGDPDEQLGALDAGDPPGDLAAASMGGDPPEDLGGFSEDPPMDLAPARKPAGTNRPAAPAGPLDTDGKEPLDGSFSPIIVSVDLDAVTVELPVLVARSAVTFSDPEYWLVAEFSVKGRKVGEARHLVNKAAISDLSPTVAWLKAQVPVIEESGEVKVTVSKMADAGAKDPLFIKQVDYRL